jgi:hypothetical protein
MSAESTSDAQHGPVGTTTCVIELKLSQQRGTASEVAETQHSELVMSWEDNHN